MQTPKLTLLITTIVVNVLLWISYIIVGLRPSDFGKIGKNAQTYFLIIAGLAYIANLVFVGLLLTKTNVDFIAASIFVAAYYILQIAFIPLVRLSQKTGNSSIVQALLLICVIPITLLAGIAVKTRDNLLIILGIFVAIHVLVNDAIIYTNTYL